MLLYLLPSFVLSHNIELEHSLIKIELISPRIIKLLELEARTTSMEGSSDSCSDAEVIKD
jgi:hypothetical protein